MSGELRWPVDEAAAGERLDRALARHLGQPRNQVRQWIADGRVTVGGRPAKPATTLAAGDLVICRPPEGPADPGVVPEAGPLAVLYEDADLVVVDKPAGIAIHPGAGRTTGTLAGILLHRYPELAGVGGPGRPGIVHRLDLGTSGALVVARSAESYLALSRAFAERRVEKTYLGVAYGTPKDDSGVVDLPIGRHRQERKKMQVRRDGRPARTGYRRRAGAGGVSLLELALETGRTHQIRVHLKAIRLPLVGDPVYGEARWRALPAAARKTLSGFPRPALHAWRLAFEHPAGAPPVAVEAPVPEDLRKLWSEVTGQPWPIP